eukprot:5835661-Pyramimonas_sp.AAC.1
MVSPRSNRAPDVRWRPVHVSMLFLAVSLVPSVSCCRSDQIQMFCRLGRRRCYTTARPGLPSVRL